MTDSATGTIGGLAAETCTVCGSHQGFTIWPGDHPRESTSCRACASTSRYRSIARGLLRAIDALTGVSSLSLAGLPAKADRTLRIFDTQRPFDLAPRCAYAGPVFLDRLPWITVTLSAYDPSLPPGAVIDHNTTMQNLESLTFPDNCFDIVVTSDVMEHVRLDDRAHREIARVLVPGGVYVFTVPHFREEYDTLVRVAVRDPDDPTRDKYVLEPEYHGSAYPNEGPVLSYRAYGTAIDDSLRALGFDVEYTDADFPELGIRKTELFYCTLGEATP